MADTTIVVKRWVEIPSMIRSHLMQQVSPGVYRHERLDIVFVCTEQAKESSPAGITRLLDDVIRYYNVVRR